ncbi:hypothetical protein [Chitinophaga vietnamensis]|uniref:hypothetical protein n=1 Tax=Chitinophaga vietnamensis TaxID=2593957 RepID=UPI001178B7E3|nr:hypothetical protein [Chitinophaga vietnamensis]
MKDQIFDSFTTADGAKFPIIIGRPNIERLHSCFLHIASGLYYYKFAKVFKGECNLIMDFVTYQDSKTEAFKLLCRKLFQIDIENLNSEGNNPDIFNYRFLEPDQFGLIALRLTFYGGANVFIAFKGEDAKEPYDLISASIDSGIETIIHFDDGSKFEFNK